MNTARQYWIMKNEVTSYSIDDLVRDRQTCWEGVRNYQARNFMRQMCVGDLAFFYHSNADPSGVAGVMRVCKAAYPDDTQWDATSKYYEPRATRERPVWERVDVECVERAPRFVPLAALRDEPALQRLLLLRPGSRLSITPITAAEFTLIARMGGDAGISVTTYTRKRCRKFSR
ncbi:MAG: EVE domain-containing protein [Deltaproteobacteria bacterium]|nr:EVE domain-containing protein [Deltaproteobacteria bacterium]